MVIKGHSGSHVLGSVESLRGTPYPYVIMLMSICPFVFQRPLSRELPRIFA